MSRVPSIKLNNGIQIPAIGFGSYAGETKEGREASTDWIVTALKSGYRHIDTAYAYGTERYVGEAIRQSGIPRNEIFVTTKLPWNHHGRVQQSLDISLKNLKAGLDSADLKGETGLKAEEYYYDLYLIHWPVALEYEGDDIVLPKNEDGTVKLAANPPSIGQVWAEMEKTLASGKAKAIGVSNFSIKTLEELLKSAKVVPAVNQVELHPYLAQNDLLAYCKDKGIQVAAYTPTGWETVRGDKTIIELADKYKVSPAQITLAWHLSRGSIAIPQSKNVDRQKDNITLPTLSPEDIEIINRLDRGQRLCTPPNDKGKVLGWTLEQLGW